MDRFRTLIAENFGVVLLISCVLGLLIPGGESIPRWVVPATLGAIIFISCSRITVAELANIRLRSVIGFYLFRFVAFPFLVFWAAAYLLPDYKFALLMLALIPCGSAMPAMAEIMRGNGTLGLSAAVVTSMLAPFLIPWAFSVVSDIEMDLDVFGMFYTLALIIFLPITLYFPLVRRIEPVKLAMRANAPALSVFLLALIVMAVVSAYRDYFFTNPWFVVESLLIGTAGFATIFFIGWAAFWRQDLKTRLTYALISGSVNIALGISVAFLHLPEREAAVLAIWEVSWLLTLSAFQMYVRSLWKAQAVPE